MTPEKTVREVTRAYRRLAHRVARSDDRFERARQAVTERLCGLVAAACDSDTNTTEARLLDQAAGRSFLAVMFDEILLWSPPEGESLLHELLPDRQLQKRPVARQFLERLQATTHRLWEVVDVHPDGWASVQRVGSDNPPRRVDFLEHGPEVAAGDRIVGRRILLGANRVFAEGFLVFPEAVTNALVDLEGAALLERAFCLCGLLVLGEDQHTLRWLTSLDGHTVSSSGRATGPGGERDHAGASSTPPHRRARPRHNSDDPERERLLERIRKLFAMAQETESSPHEAEIALRRCQSLMTKFGITEADLETSEFAVASVATGRTVATHVKLLGGAVALLHDVLFVIGRGGLAEFRGYEIDVRVATMTFNYLKESIERALSLRKRRGELPPGRSAAFDYRVAFAEEVYMRVCEIAEEREALERAQSATGTALVLRKRERVDQEFGEDLVHKRVRMLGPQDSEAADAGREDGQDVSLDPQIG